MPDWNDSMVHRWRRYSRDEILYTPLTESKAFENRDVLLSLSMEHIDDTLIALFDMKLTRELLDTICLSRVAIFGVLSFFVKDYNNVKRTFCE